MKLFDNFAIEDSQPRAPSTNVRAWLPILLLSLVVGLLIGRSFWLQVMHGASLRERAEHNRVYRIITEAPRGIIYDPTGLPLVSNVPATDLVFDPRSLPPREGESFLIDNILRLVPALQPDQVRSALEKCRTSGQVVPIARALDHAMVLTLEEQQENVRGTQLVSSLVRNYESGYALAHILGYTGLSEKTGKQGLEKTYDASLRGTPGVTYQEVNASGKLQTQLGSSASVPGQDMTITIDYELQKFIYGLFSEREHKHPDERTAGAAIVLDPRSGEVVAAVSYPSFDPNAFSQPRHQDEVAAYLADPRQPLFNRAADGMYPSGSTIKPFLAAAALQEGIITPQTTVVSTGGITVGPWTFPDWKSGGHGITNVTKALAESVNTFFYAITGGYDNQPGLGVQRATAYLAKFGWGKPTGIDLPSEAAGFLPSPSWKLATTGEPWYIGDTYHLGIGQGDILVTPLQLATATAALADGHSLRQPHFSQQPTASHSKNLPFSAASIDVVRQGMRQAVTDGSARALAVLPVDIAGKTGTAQIGGTAKTHAWFTGFAPYDHPQFVVTVLLEQAGEGDKEAVPFAKEIWQWLLEKRLAGQ